MQRDTEVYSDDEEEQEADSVKILRAGLFAETRPRPARIRLSHSLARLCNSRRLARYLVAF